MGYGYHHLVGGRSAGATAQIIEALRTIAPSCALLERKAVHTVMQEPLRNTGPLPTPPPPPPD